MTILFLLFELIQNTIFDIAFIWLEAAKSQKTFEQKTFDFIKQTQSQPQPLIPIRTIEKIEFKNVSFSCSNAQTPTINNLSFVLNKGDTVALLGLNGVGKTTLTKLLLGLYSTQSGIIFITDINLSEIDKTSFFNLVTYLEQEPNLFSISLIDFFSAKTKHKDYDKAKACLEMVGLYPKIAQSKHNLDT